MSAQTQLTESPMLCFETEVVRVVRLSPSFARITFGGACLSRFHDCGELGPRDLRIKVIVPVDGRPPDLVDMSGPGWYTDWLQRDPRERGEMRTYTVRSARPDAEPPEVDVDFVLHAHGEQSGPAAAWAESAQVGDRMLLLGPNRACPDPYGGIAWQPPGGGGRRVLLVGDETAVPAISSILATLPASYAGRAVLEVASPEDFLPMTSAADVEVTWLARSHRARGELLGQAVREAMAPSGAVGEVPEVDPELLWETPQDLGLDTDGSAPYVWIAGEAGVVKELRRYLVGEVGVPRSSVAFMGYWREGAVL
jgi:NADPH-dependent ferric siderophore reductase